MRYSLIFSLLLISFSTLAGELNVKDLKVGDRLEGINKVTKRECTIDVVKKDHHKGNAEIIIVLDGKENEEYRLRYRKGLLTYEFAGELDRNAQAVLKTGKISDETTFRIIQELYDTNRFIHHTVVNCLKLKKA
ncbi:MAG: hypothetical protein NDI69_00730 [Bacteriovoracaceae bacterium]|nr:hypothetical protein [Bacteriovoracaceae bacterium]